MATVRNQCPPARQEPSLSRQPVHSVQAAKLTNKAEATTINEELGLERGRRVPAQPGSVLLLPADREEERPALAKGSRCFPACSVPASWLPSEALKCK